MALGFGRRVTRVRVIAGIPIHGVAVGEHGPRRDPFAAVVPLLRFRRVAQRRRRPDVHLKVRVVVGRLI